jgi:hypothetical protein
MIPTLKNPNNDQPQELKLTKGLHTLSESAIAHKIVNCRPKKS